MKTLNSTLMLLGRLLLAGVFIFGGMNKFINYDATVAFFAAKNVPSIPFVLSMLAIAEIIGGVFVLLGFKTRMGALTLIIYLGVVTYFFHDFWNLPTLGAIMKEGNSFFALFAGLFYVFSCGAGPYSIDKK